MRKNLYSFYQSQSVYCIFILNCKNTGNIKEGCGKHLKYVFNIQLYGYTNNLHKLKRL